MAEIRYFPGATAHSIRESQAPRQASEEQSAINTDKYCAYNQTSQRFVASGIEVADGNTGAVEARLLALEPSGETAIWIRPFRRISSACARFPIDLVFLDSQFAVLDTAEFFPMNVGGAQSAPAASVLVLAADSVSQGGIRAGDQLLITSPEEMMRYLQRQQNPDARTLAALQPAFRKDAGEAEEQGGTNDAPALVVSGPAPVEEIEVPQPADADDLPVQQKPPEPISQRNEGALFEIAAPSVAHEEPLVQTGEGLTAAPTQIPLEFPGWNKPALADSIHNESAPATNAAELPAKKEPATARDVGSESVPAAAVAAGAPVHKELAPLTSHTVHEVPAILAPVPIQMTPVVTPRVQGAGAPPALAAGPTVEKETAAATDDQSVSAPQRSSAQSPPPVQPAATMIEQRQPWMKTDPPKTWIERLVVGKIPDPRTSQRESLPGLVAYFFTGGPPAPHAVRDISATGLFLVTQERWYRGTVVQMTLTDRKSATFERSISLYAKAVRLGSDGVGFRFVLEGDRQRPSRELEAYAPTNGIDIVKVGTFIQNFRATQPETEG